MKKKRVGIILLMIALMLSLGQIRSIFAAENGRELGKSDITEITSGFTDGNGKISTDRDITLDPIATGKSGIGTAWLNFYVKVDLTDISKNGVTNELKGNDTLRIAIPKNIPIGQGTFKKPELTIEHKTTNDSVHIANISVDETTNEVVIIFLDSVKSQEEVVFDLKFQSGVIVKEKKEELRFNLFDNEIVLTINAEKIPDQTGHILKKIPSGEKYSEDGKYGLFQFTLFVNRNGGVGDPKKPLDEIVIHDQIQENSGSLVNWDEVIFDQNSFSVVEGIYDDDKIDVFKKEIHAYDSKTGVLKYAYGADESKAPDQQRKMELTFHYADNNQKKPRSFDLTIPNAGTNGYIIRYYVMVPVSEVGRGAIANVASIEDTKTKTRLKTGFGNDTETKYVRNLVMSGSASGQSNTTIDGRIKIVKRDQDNQPVAGATFKLTNIADPQETHEKTTTQTGELLFSGLKLATYSIEEVDVPSGYLKSAGIADVTLSDVKSAEIVKVKNTRKTIDITVEKRWEGKDAQEQDIMFTLKRKAESEVSEPAIFAQNKVVVSKELEANDKNDDNVVEFKGLYEYDENGKKYEYYVSESPKLQDYEAVEDVKVELQGGVWKAVVVNTKKTQAPVKPQPPVKPEPQPPVDPKPQPPVKPQPSPEPPISPETSEPTVPGAVSKVEKIEPKKEEQPKPQPKPEEPKVEQPKPEEPKQDQPSVEEPVEPSTPSTTVEKVITGGSTSGENKTDVLPGSIPNTSSQKEDKNKTAVDPQSVKKLPKTGEGLNASAYTAIFAMLGLSFVGFGAYKKIKNTK